MLAAISFESCHRFIGRVSLGLIIVDDDLDVSSAVLWQPSVAVLRLCVRIAGRDQHQHRGHKAIEIISTHPFPILALLSYG